MTDNHTIDYFLIWHPAKGFYNPPSGPTAFADLDPDCIDLVQELNDEDGTNNRNGWRALRITIGRWPPISTKKEK